jgi:hypothetical protein
MHGAETWQDTPACRQCIMPPLHSIMFFATLPTGHHPGFGKWCLRSWHWAASQQASITLHTSAAYWRHKRWCQQQTYNKHALDWGNTSHCTAAKQLNAMRKRRCVPPPRLPNQYNKGTTTTQQRDHHSYINVIILIHTLASNFLIP